MSLTRSNSASFMPEAASPSAVPATPIDPLALPRVVCSVAHRVGDTVELPGGVKCTDHFFQVPLDWAQGSNARAERITVFAREVRLRQVDAERAARPDLAIPAMLYLQGGPGFSSPRLLGSGGWVRRLLNEDGGQVLFLLDQRGTGRSTLLTPEKILARGPPMEQAQFLKRFRADAIVSDCEAIRLTLLRGGQKWRVLGQSFGGFCLLHYLSKYPGSLEFGIFTGGLPPLRATAQEVYRCTFRKLIDRNTRFYNRYPMDILRVRRIVRILADAPQPMAYGGALTAMRFLQLGLVLGGGSGMEELHNLLELAFPDDSPFAETQEPDWELSPASARHPAADANSQPRPTMRSFRANFHPKVIDTSGHNPDFSASKASASPKSRSPKSGSPTPPDMDGDPLPPPHRPSSQSPNSFGIFHSIRSSLPFGSRSRGDEWAEPEVASPPAPPALDHAFDGLQIETPSPTPPNGHREAGSEPVPEAPLEADLRVSRLFLRGVDIMQAWESNPLYAILHESIYCQGRPAAGGTGASAWAAWQVMQEPEFDTFFNWRAALENRHADALPTSLQLVAAPGGRAGAFVQPIFFTGEMVFPWMFQGSYGLLAPLREAADLVAQEERWSWLYDVAALTNTRVPCSAAVFHDDMYVDRGYSEATASALGSRCRVWVSRKHEHSALRDDGYSVLEKLLHLLSRSTDERA